MTGGVQPGPVADLDRLDRGGSFDVRHQWQVVRYGMTALGDWMRESPLGAGVRSVFVVTSPSCERQDLPGVVGLFLGGVKVAGTYGRCTPHSPAGDVVAVADAIAESDADLVIALGGGSVMDTAKTARLFPAGTSTATVLDVLRTGTPPPIADPRPMIAVPTTLSGAELTAIVGITDDDTLEKVVVPVVRGAPDEIVFDPRVTAGTPDRIWHATGVKCMSDACEEIVSTASSPVVDALCARSIPLFREHLPRSSESLESRLACQLATWLTLFGIISAGVGAGIGAALRHQLGAYTGLAHGRVAAALLEPVIRFNWDSLGAGRPELLAAWGCDPTAAVPDDLVGEIGDLLAALDVVVPLGVELPDAALTSITTHALAEFPVRTNPRRVTDPAELRPVVLAATEGRS